MNRWTETHTVIRGQCSFKVAILQVHILIAAHASLHLASFGRGKVRSALIDQLAASIVIVDLLNECVGNARPLLSSSHDFQLAEDI